MWVEFFLPFETILPNLRSSFFSWIHDYSTRTFLQLIATLLTSVKMNIILYANLIYITN